MRVDYRRGTLLEERLGEEPIAAARAWLHEAAESEAREPNAMALATCDAGGRPSVRVVLCKGLDERGLAFYTNLASRKAEELERVPFAAATFWWAQLERQVRFEGRVEPVAADEADAYFERRPRGSRLGAWASPQSRPVADRAELERLLEETRARFAADVPVPRPDFWGGYRIVPDRIEFWQGGRDRLHRRLDYRRDDGHWSWRRLQP